MLNSKRGQFYLIAAVVIVIIIIGFFSVTNFSRTDGKDTRVYDLGEELNIETGKVYDYGIYKGKAIDILMDDWTGKYINYSKGRNVIDDWIFIYGDTSEMNSITFSLRDVGTVGFKTSTGTIGVDVIKGVKEKKIIGSGGEVNLTFNNFDYHFDLKKGENFFFVIGSEGYVFKG